MCMVNGNNNFDSNVLPIVATYVDMPNFHIKNPGSFLLQMNRWTIMYLHITLFEEH